MSSLSNAVDVKAVESEMAQFRKELKRMEKALSRSEINIIQRRHAKPILEDMKVNSKSVRIAEMTAITTRQGKRPRAPRIGIRIGVINNDESLFPKEGGISAPALASVIEYGTAERYRKIKGLLFTGAQSTGSMPAAPWLRPAWDRGILQFIAKTEKSMMDKVSK